MGLFLVVAVIMLTNPLMLFAMPLLLYLLPAMLIWIVISHIAHDVYSYFAETDEARPHT